MICDSGDRDGDLERDESSGSPGGNALTLIRKFESPLYAAMMEWIPFPSDDVVSVACPDPLTGTVARTALPSLNVIVPVGVPEAGDTAFTVAVNVTAVPTPD